MEKIKIVTDSTLDLPSDIVKEKDIEVDIDGFKEKLKVNQQKQMEDKEKIVQIEQKNRETEGRETR